MDTTTTTNLWPLWPILGVLIVGLLIVARILIVTHPKQ
jgi:hypothetical protein